MRALLALLVAVGCGSHAPPSNQTTAAALDPPPPSGVVIPAIGRAHDIQTHTAAVWQATFDVDPSDPRVAAVVDKHRPHTAEERDLQRRIDAAGTAQRAFSAGDAGAELYLDQVRAASIPCDDTGYRIQNGALEVIVRSRGNSSFQIFVSTPGG